MSILLVLNSDHGETAALAATARRWWEQRGEEVVVWEERDGDPPDVRFAISLGGDGTMLRTVQLALARKVPVLGVNLGRMGYLAEVEPAGLEAALARLAAGDYVIEERMVLEVEVTTAGGQARYLALNEALVEKTGPGHTIHVAVGIGGRPFLTYVADGLLASTPTGSTAYNLSARGPVVSPRLRAIILTPVAPHLVFDRSLVLDGDETVEMTLLPRHDAAAVIDGARVIDLSPGDAVACRAAPERARLVTFGSLDSYSVLRARFGIEGR